MALLDRDRWSRGHHPGSLRVPAPTALDHGPLVVIEIAYGSDPRRELPLQGSGDDSVELVGAQFVELVEGASGLPSPHTCTWVSISLGSSVVPGR